MPIAPRGPVTFKELTAGLIWPLIWRAVPDALLPARIGLGAGFVVLIMAFGALVDWIAPGESAPFHATAGAAATGLDHLARGGATLDVWQAQGGLDALARAGEAARDRPVTSVAIALVALALASIFGGAISRIAACDIALDRRVGALEGLSFALARWRSLLGAPLVPLAVLTIVGLLMLALGWALFSLPVVGVLGGALYVVYLLAGLGLTGLWLAFVLGGPMLAPAVVVESTDAGDAVQRSYSYVLGRTGRLLLYAALLALYGAVAWAIASWFVEIALGLASRLAFAWTSAGAPYAPPARSLFSPSGSPGVEGARAVSAGLIGLWERGALALLAGFAVSYFYTASTILYLLLRRVNDEQDIEDIWTGDRPRGA